MNRPILFSSLLLLLLFFGVILGGHLTARSIDGIRQQGGALPESTVATARLSCSTSWAWAPRENARESSIAVRMRFIFLLGKLF